MITVDDGLSASPKHNSGQTSVLNNSPVDGETRRICSGTPEELSVAQEFVSRKGRSSCWGTRGRSFDAQSIPHVELCTGGNAVQYEIFFWATCTVKFMQISKSS